MTLPQSVKVATDALRTEAGVWDQQSAQMGTIAGQAEDLRFSRLQAGVFQIVVGAYNDVVEQVHSRCQEAVTRMKEIADTLQQVAAVYEKEEIDGAHLIKNTLPG
jgi:hypothetical protein